MPCVGEKRQTFECGQCNRQITRFAKDKMSAVRRHYRDNHPRKFRESIKRGVEARKKSKHK